MMGIMYVTILVMSREQDPVLFFLSCISTHFSHTPLPARALAPVLLIAVRLRSLREDRPAVRVGVLGGADRSCRRWHAHLEGDRAQAEGEDRLNIFIRKNT